MQVRELVKLEVFCNLAKHIIKHRLSQTQLFIVRQTKALKMFSPKTGYNVWSEPESGSFYAKVY